MFPLSHYTFEELSVGQRASFESVIDQNKIDKFYDITGDCNPLHRNLEFAKSHGYPSCVVYGMLTASQLSTLAGVFIPGERSLIQQVEVKFLSPVFPDEKLFISGEIEELNESVQQIVLKVNITVPPPSNIQELEGQTIKPRKVLRGKMKVLVLND